MANFDFDESFDRIWKFREELKRNEGIEYNQDAAVQDEFASHESVRLIYQKGETALQHKSMEKISALMDEYKEALVEEHGYKEGVEKYNDTFLDGGKTSKKMAIEKLYRYMVHSMREGHMKKRSISDDKVSSLDLAKNYFDRLIISPELKKQNPPLPSNFVDEMFKEYANDVNNIIELRKESWKILNTQGREDQIKYIKEHIDPLYTKTQRFKEVCGNIKLHHQKQGLITSIMSAPVAIPTFIANGAVKVFGGEAGEMSAEDTMQVIESKLTNIKSKINSLPFPNIKDTLESIRVKAMGGTSENNRFRKDI